MTGVGSFVVPLIPDRENQFSMAQKCRYPCEWMTDETYFKYFHSVYLLCMEVKAPRSHELAFKVET